MPLLAQPGRSAVDHCIWEILLRHISPKPVMDNLLDPRQLFAKITPFIIDYLGWRAARGFGALVRNDDTSKMEVLRESPWVTGDPGNL